MDRKQSDKRLDDWLDEALEEYGRSEPRAGIELRILARLHGQSKYSAWRARKWRPVWMPAAVAVALLCVVMLFFTPQKPPAPPVAAGNDQELLRGVNRLLNKEVPSALEPALVLTDEMAKNQ